MKKHVDRTDSIEMRMLKWLSCKTRKDTIGNENIRDGLEFIFKLN